VPITFVGQTCARRGCTRPHYKDGLCGRCWRFAKLFKKDPRMLAYKPLEGGLDSVELPWEQWETEARARGVDVVDLLAQQPPPEGGADA
jgi:hypothetical protein